MVMSNPNEIMDDDEDSGFLFGIPDFSLSLKRSAHFEDVPDSLFLEDDIIDTEIKRPEYGIIIPDQPLEKGCFFVLPDFSFSSTEESRVPSPSIEHETRSIRDESSTAEDPLEDSGPRPAKLPRCLTWEVFEDAETEEPYTSYVTEAGPRTFDAALADEADIFTAESQDYLVVDMAIYVSSLLSMGLGRGSVLFFFDEDKGAFVQVVPKLRVTGCTGGIVEDIRETFMNCGNLVRSLEQFVEKSYRQHVTSSKVALADAVSILLRSLQSQLQLTTRGSPTLLQIQEAIRPAQSLLVCFDNLAKSTQTASSDEKILSILFEEITVLEHKSDSTTEILSEVLSHVSRPFLDFAGEWLGTQREPNNARMERTGHGRSFIRTENRQWLDEQGIEMSEPDYVLSTEDVPSFLSKEDAHTLFETGRGLRFLRTHHPDHPLARADVIASASPPPLHWENSWQKIEEIEERAAKYEHDLTEAIKHLSKSTSVQPVEAQVLHGRVMEDDCNYFGLPEEEVGAQFLATISAMERPLPEVTHIDRLSVLLKAGLASDNGMLRGEDLTTTVPLSLAPYLSFNPLIAAQARVVNGASMRLFFQCHNLREHLSVQRRFQLLGDGVFSSRLSHALFDPDLETAERQAGVARTGGLMGLRLGGRESWPPATSELRLALMGVLSDSYTSSQSPTEAVGGGFFNSQNQLPGELSFAVRDMTDEEIAKCIDPNSVEALDFLRLSYKAPAPLEAVITPMALYKYDQLFKLLLRVLRMLYSVGQLFRDATDRTSYWQGMDDRASRFRIEAHHFVSCVAAYFLDVGIAGTWAVLERKLDETERRISADEGFAVLGPHEGVDGLREFHERVLDRIMFSLLLRKRQRPVMAVLEDIFEAILAFARHSRLRAAGLKRKVGGADEEVGEMHERFRRKVGVFVDVCRGMAARKGFGERGEAAAEEERAARTGLFDTRELVEEENTIVQLLGRLEASGHY